MMVIQRMTGGIQAFESLSTGGKSAVLTFTGVVVVFVALLGLWALVAVVGKLFTAMTQKPKAPEPPAPKAPAPKAPAPAALAKPAMTVEDGIEEEVVAVIAAAVASMSGPSGGYAVRSVRRVKEARSPWAQAGVMQNTQRF